MKVFLTDPIVLLCSGIILIGLFGLVWAIGKFRGLSSATAGPGPMDAGTSSGISDLRGMDFGISPLPTRAMAPPPPAPALSKDMADRLESMTQRLAEMQSLLNKQNQAGAA